MTNHDPSFTNVKNPVGDRAATSGAKVAAIIVVAVGLGGALLSWSPWQNAARTSAGGTVGSSIIPPTSPGAAHKPRGSGTSTVWTATVTMALIGCSAESSDS